MNRKIVEMSSLPAKSAGLGPVGEHHPPIQAIALCTFAFISCILISVAPLTRMAGKAFLLSLPTNSVLLLWGAWFPADLHVASIYRASTITTDTIEFILLMAIAFSIYGLCAYFIQRQPKQDDNTRVMRLIWLGTIVAGLIFVLTPAMLSRDVFVYVGYGRTIVVHHANPYFVAQSSFPQDPLTAFDDWKNATSAYGPAWLTICALWTLILGNSPLEYALVFRLFALTAHLLNVWLVATILRKMECSARAVALGTLLYAWNPLVLQESSMDGHNDVFMITLLLLGTLLCLRTEQGNFSRPSHYLPPIIVFTLAALVKFTALPLIIFFLAMLARKTLYPPLSASLTNNLKVLPHWRSMILKVLLAGIVSGCVAFTFYAPFWIGHSIHDIASSFSSPPSAHFSENSLMRATIEWIKLHGMPVSTSWAYIPIHILSLRYVWDWIDYIMSGCMLLIGTFWIWRVPTTRTVVRAGLVTLGVLLIVTPWFFAWYVTWLVGLAAICLPTANNRIGQALGIFALTFSGTAYVTYLFNSYPPIGGWSFLAWSLMIVPPLLLFLLMIILKKKALLRSLDNSSTIPA